MQVNSCNDSLCTRWAYTALTRIGLYTYMDKYIVSSHRVVCVYVLFLRRCASPQFNLIK